ncbi:hypothetical protein BJ912DRAFT_852706 [Pholiota molesta]|nr:hypothetical protein BJ912DRAFT_852706 [Pholiota molesta]
MNLVEDRDPPSYRYSTHIFTPQDFDTSMLRCQAVLSQPQGRAALLKGGIIWRIAKQFLSSDGVLDGPSVEVTSHRVGYSHASGTPKVQYCDDDLTENEIGIICGTYSLYTSLGQVTVKSWFPPPVCWNKDRTGVQWIEWTARNEQFFTDLLEDIKSGKAVPLTVVEWTSRLRGWRLSRSIRDNNRIRTSAFFDTYVPIPPPKNV